MLVSVATRSVSLFLLVNHCLSPFPLANQCWLPVLANHCLPPVSLANHCLPPVSLANHCLPPVSLAYHCLSPVSLANHCLPPVSLAYHYLSLSLSPVVISTICFCPLWLVADHFWSLLTVSVAGRRITVVHCCRWAAACCWSWSPLLVSSVCWSLLLLLVTAGSWSSPVDVTIGR